MRALLAGLLAVAVGRLGGAAEQPDLFGGMFGPLAAEQEAAKVVVAEEKEVLEEKEAAVEEAESDLKAAETPDETADAEEALEEAEENVAVSQEVIEEAGGLGIAASEQAEMLDETLSSKERLVKALEAQAAETTDPQVNETAKASIATTLQSPLEACLGHVAELDAELSAALESPHASTELAVASLPGQAWHGGIHWPVEPTLDRFGTWLPGEASAVPADVAPEAPVSLLSAAPIPPECARAVEAVRRKHGLVKGDAVA